MRVLVLLLAPVALAHTYNVDGIVLAIDSGSHTMLVSHRPIARYMPAMAMPFRAERAADLDGLYPGARIEFELVVDRRHSVARNIRKAATPDAIILPAKARLQIGEPIPEFRLTDQSGREVRPGDFCGKIAVIDFIYTRCPLPDVCPRLSANFAALQRRFQAQMGNDLVLLSITVDPDYDTPAVLADYARRWGARPGWSFLSGDVSKIATALGEVYWNDEGSIGHNSTTSILGRDGRLAATLEGSNYRFDQLANLIAHQLER